MSPPRDFAARLAVAEDRIDGQGSEIQRIRERVHLLEGDRSAIRLAVSQLNDLRQEIPAMARTVADETISLALGNRDQLRRDQLEESRRGLSFRAQLVGGALGIGSFLILIYDHFG